MICTLSKHEEAKGFTDSLMLDHEGNIAEATGANIFLKQKVKNYILLFQILFRWNNKERVIKIAKAKGIKVVERKIKPSEMKDFVGCFLTVLQQKYTCLTNRKF